ncbi:MAG: glycosyltransferase family 39 protein, partial [Myxococcota bacterium]
AKRVFGPRVGLWNAFFLSFMPLWIYLNHFYTMEIPQTFFSLLTLLFVLRWQDEQRRSDLVAAALCCIVGYECDIYPALWSPVFFLWGLYDWNQNRSRERLLGWLLLTSLGPLCVLGQLAHLKWYGWSKGFMVSGVSKYSTPWDYWFRLDFHTYALKRIFLNTAWVPALLAPLGVRGWSKWDKGQRFLFVFLLALPILDYLILAKAVNGHHYRVMFFFPLIALLAAKAITRFSTTAQAGLVAVFVVAAGLHTPKLYTVLRPGDVSTARQIRELTTDKDILVALPPHMTYYIDRPSVVPYYYLWRHASLDISPPALFSELHHLAEEKDYERIVVFTQFILPSDFPPLDWSKAFDGIPNLKRVTQPGQDPQVWEFQTGSSVVPGTS